MWFNLVEQIKKHARHECRHFVPDECVNRFQGWRSHTRSHFGNNLTCFGLHPLSRRRSLIPETLIVPAIILEAWERGKERGWHVSRALTWEHTHLPQAHMHAHTHTHTLTSRSHTYLNSAHTLSWPKNNKCVPHRKFTPTWWEPFSFLEHVSADSSSSLSLTVSVVTMCFKVEGKITDNVKFT